LVVLLLLLFVANEEEEGVEVELAVCFIGLLTSGGREE
jgi:hypothetical protein